jgi:hypothetical protein
MLLPSSRDQIFTHAPLRTLASKWSISPDGFPILHGSLGALSYRVVGAPLPLNDLAALGDKLPHKAEGTCDGVDVDGVESELLMPK